MKPIVFDRVIMDDLFGLLYGNLDPARKLLTAVNSNMVCSVQELINTGLDINQPLMKQNGFSALHVCCDKGHVECARLLLKAGANPDVENSFGFTPLMLALRKGEGECVKELFKSGTCRTDPYLVWGSHQIDGLPTWLSYDAQVLQVLLVATPNFTATLHFNVMFLFYTKKICTAREPDLVKVFFLTGNRLATTEDKANLMANANSDLKKWIKNFHSTVQPLQHYSRLAVRRNLHPNVFYGAKVLPLPQKLQEYLILMDEY